MAGEALVDLSQCAPWQVRERHHADMAGGGQGGMVESHSHHADTTPTCKVLLGGREKGRVGKWVGTERRRERKMEEGREEVCITSWQKRGRERARRGRSFLLKRTLCEMTLSRCWMGSPGGGSEC